MKTSAARVSLLVVGLLSSATLLQAHPGHDGHDLTWDARHLANHPLATMGCAAVLGAAAFLAVRAVRALRDSRTERITTRR